MNKHLKLRLRSVLVCLSIVFSPLFSVIQAQINTAEVLKRYTDPAQIDPLNIRIGEYYTEDFNNLKMAANLAYSREDFKSAAQIYLYIVNKNSDDCESYYRIACCYGRMGMANNAIDFLIMAINSGYNNFENINKEDAFELIKKDPLIKSQFDELRQYGRAFGEVTYFKVTKLEKCRIYFPENFDPEKEYPLVIGLHGNGGNTLEFSLLWDNIKDMDIIYAVPESPYNYSTNGGALTQQYSWGIISRDKNLWETSDPFITEYISAIATGIKTEYKINNTILLGFSQGAAYAYSTGIRYHENFDGLICFGGRLPSVEDYPWLLSAKELEENIDLKVFIAHGVDDNAHILSEGRKASRTLRKLGYKTKLRIFEGGHYVPGNILVEAIKWMGNKN